MTKIQAGMTTEQGNGIPACIYGKNKMPDGFGRFIVGVNDRKFENEDCRNLLISSIMKAKRVNHLLRE